VIFYACDAVKRNAQGRRRDKHKKAEQDASQAADNEEPELPPVDEETLRREREEALRRWREEQRKKYPVAPDGMGLWPATLMWHGHNINHQYKSKIKKVVNLYSALSQTRL